MLKKAQVSISNIFQKDCVLELFRFSALKSCLSTYFMKSPKQFFLRTLPIFSWLSTYNKESAIGDIISGCTVAAIHIPQGMGLAIMAGLPAVSGIYMV
jgi:hypothetical protein